jgi:hypothetical protein
MEHAATKKRRVRPRRGSPLAEPPKGFSVFTLVAAWWGATPGCGLLFIFAQHLQVLCGELAEDDDLAALVAGDVYLGKT